jgi:hypothetical protein
MTMPDGVVVATGGTTGNIRGIIEFIRDCTTTPPDVPAEALQNVLDAQATALQTLQVAVARRLG